MANIDEIAAITAMKHSHASSHCFDRFCRLLRQLKRVILLHTKQW